MKYTKIATQVHLALLISSLSLFGTAGLIGCSKHVDSAPAAKPNVDPTITTHSELVSFAQSPSDNNQALADKGWSDNQEAVSGFDLSTSAQDDAAQNRKESYVTELFANSFEGLKRDTIMSLIFRANSLSEMPKEKGGIESNDSLNSMTYIITVLQGMKVANGNSFDGLKPDDVDAYVAKEPFTEVFARMAKFDEKFAEVETRFGLMSKAIDDLDKKLDQRMAEEAQKREAAVQSAIAKADELDKATNARVEAANARLNETNERITLREQTIPPLEKSEKELQKQIRRLERNQSNDENMLRTPGKGMNIAQVSGDLDKTKDSLSKANDALGKIQGDLGVARTRLAELDKEQPIK